MREKLKYLKILLLGLKLRNHKIDNNDLYCFHYVFVDGKQTIDYIYPSFLLPQGLSREDAFFVLSYVKDCVLKHTDYKNDTWEMCNEINSKLEQYGFTFVVNNDIKPIELYIINGNIKKFKKTKFYRHYFNWYTPLVDVFQSSGAKKLSL